MTTRSGTEVRQRTHQVGVRLTGAELAVIQGHADRACLSLADALRSLALARAANQRTEWGLRYGDGEIESPLSYQDARRMRRDHRDAIASGEVDADDYEPMRLVRRTVTTETTDWEDSRA